MDAAGAAVELRSAMRQHDEAWQATKHLPLAGLRGPVAEANDRIGSVRMVANGLIMIAGKWPGMPTQPKLAIGNDECLRLLDEIATA